MPTQILLSALLFVLAAPAGLVGMPGGAGQAFAGQMIFHQHVVIRIPRMPEPDRPPAPLMPPPTWDEKGGPKCLASEDLVAATIPTSDSVDLLLRDGERMRAKLDKKCRALDFYTGFYVEGGRDGRVCARRDTIRTRSGDDCGIDKFKRLVLAH
jgi:hypothetical protein